MFRNRLISYEGAGGFILDWMITGFFPGRTVGGRAPNLFDAKTSRHWTKDYLKAYGGESAVRGIPRPRGIGPIEWLPLQAPKYYPKLQLGSFRRAYGQLDQAWPAKWDHIWYALAVIECDTAQQAELRFCGHDGHRLWWNGRLVDEEHSWHKVIFDYRTAAVRLRKGRNTILLKLDRFGLVARLTGPTGKRLTGTVRSLSPARPRPEPPGTFDQMARYSRTLKVTMPCRAKTPAQFRRWKRAARAHFRTAMGALPQAGAGRARLIEKATCDGYTRYCYHLTREAGTQVPVYVLAPDKRRFNGRTIICPHGHGQDERVLAGIDPAPRPRGNWCGPFTGNYAELLARAGFLTACWSERVLSRTRSDMFDRLDRDPCNMAGLCALSVSMTLPGLHLYDLHGVTDFVIARHSANPRRLGLTGLSGGGTMTYLAGAYDERFKAVAPFCGIHSYADYARCFNNCGQQIVPNLYPTLDVGELLCMTAPRPLLLGQGRLDATFNIFLLGRLARQARKAYAALGAADRVELHLHEHAHQLDVDAAADFFLRHL